MFLPIPVGEVLDPIYPVAPGVLLYQIRESRVVQRRQIGSVVQHLGHRVACQCAAFEFKHHQPPIAIDTQEIERTTVGRHLSPDERQVLHQEVGGSDEQIFEMLLRLRVIDRMDWRRAQTPLGLIHRPQLDLLHRSILFVFFTAPPPPIRTTPTDRRVRSWFAWFRGDGS